MRGTAVDTIRGPEYALAQESTAGEGLLVALESLFALRKGKKASEFFEKFKETIRSFKNRRS